MKGQYIQIYHAAMNSGCLIEKCGSDSIIALDGRLSLGSCIDLAITHCRNNNEIGFRIMRKVGMNWGDSLTDLCRVSPHTVEC